MNNKKSGLFLLPVIFGMAFLLTLNTKASTTSMYYSPTNPNLTGNVPYVPTEFLFDDGGTVTSSNGMMFHLHFGKTSNSMTWQPTMDTIVCVPGSATNYPCTRRLEVSYPYSIGNFQTGQTYYWQAGARADSKNYEGDIWNFTYTGINATNPNKPTLLSPVGEINTSPTEFVWQGSDPDIGDAVHYKMRFGTSSTNLLEGNHTYIAITTSTSSTIVSKTTKSLIHNDFFLNKDILTQEVFFDNGIKYYWQIEAQDSAGNIVKSEINSFTVLENLLSLNLNESPSSTTFIDTSGLNNHATCVAQSCPQAGVSGMSGSAIRLDGIDDQVEVLSSGS
ncbi:MAG: hypothetical protein ABH832_04625, partial [bacterium]